VTLWLLSRRDGGARIYDQFVEMLVRAPTETRARQLAYDFVAKEDHRVRQLANEFEPVGREQLIVWERIASAWLDPVVTAATALHEPGIETVITAHFKHG
jgi:hypothetical protein